MIVIITSYIVVVFLVIRLGITAYNFYTKPLLPFYKEVLSGYKSLSILIPVRNEEDNIERLMLNLEGFQNLPGLMEIIVLDDHSKDKTNAIVQNFVSKNQNIKLITGKKLPTGWLGKNWACHQLAEAAKGDLILFIDADVELTQEAISNSIFRVQDSKLDLLSLFPDQKMETQGEKMVVPLMHYLLLSLLPLRLVRTSPFTSLAAANGQFMLFRAETYHRYHFHELVKNNVLDDVNIMRSVKSKGLKGEVLLGNNQVFCRMYHSGKEAFEGFSKNLFPGFGNNVVGFQLYFYLIFWGWIALALSFNIQLLILATAMSLAIRMMISKLANQSVEENIMLHPLQMCNYAVIGLNSMYIHLTGKVSWKGRKL